MKIFAMCAIAGSVTFASAGTYSGPGGPIPDFIGAAGVFQSLITVAGDTDFPITSVSVTLRGFTHTWIGDLTCVVVSPNGTVHTLFSRIGRVGPTGGDSSNVGGEYTFADSGTNLWSAAASGGNNFVIPSGTYRTSGGLSASPTSMNDAFAGENGNGIWTLALHDNAVGDTGGITGWQLTIVPAPGALALAGLGGIVTARRKRR